MDGVTDGLQVALLGQMRQQSLHAAVEQLIIVKLERKKKIRTSWLHDTTACANIHRPQTRLGGALKSENSLSAFRYESNGN